MLPAVRRPVPLPSLELMEVGGTPVEGDAESAYLEVGRALREEIHGLLPPDWSFAGRRVLDFGCGTGRVLRHFLAEAEEGEMWGCDINEDAIRWLERELSPPLRVFANRESPPLPLGSGDFDLIWAFSVFTHITDEWSAWLLELHRLLADGGLLIASFCGPGMGFGPDPAPWLEPWDEERIGMHVLAPQLSWEKGGPYVTHSRWWLRAHWGRAFEVLELRPGGLATVEGQGQGVIVLRKSGGDVSREELELPEPGEPRELDALALSALQTRRELVALSQWHGGTLAWEREQRALAEAERDEALDRLDVHIHSRSWRLTAPLRRLGEVARAIARRPRWAGAGADEDRGAAPFDADAAACGGYRYTTDASLSSRLAYRRQTEASLAVADFRDRRVLDIGCGDGAATLELLDVAAPASMEGIDPAPAAIEAARGRDPEGKVSFAVASAYDLPYPPGAFDVAVLRGVLHHLDDPERALGEALRVAPRVVVVEPNGFNPGLKLLERVSPYHVEHGEKSYAPSTLDRWSRSLGGRVERRVFAGFVPMFSPDPLARAMKRLEPLVENVPLVRSVACAIYVFAVARDDGAQPGR